MKPVIFNCEQGSEEWFNLRLGIPTASNFSKILAKGQGKTRKSHMYDLAEEIIKEEIKDSYVSDDMENGREYEAEAREHYESINKVKVEQVGFIKLGDIGCSPDGLIGDEGGLEIKCPKYKTQIKRIDENVFPYEYKPQVQGSLMITGRKWWDFFSYCRGLQPFQVRICRDEEYIKKLRKECDVFIHDLSKLIDKLVIPF